MFNLAPLGTATPLAIVILLPTILYSAFVLSPIAITAPLVGADVNVIVLALLPSSASSVQPVLLAPATKTLRSLAVIVL